MSLIDGPAGSAGALLLEIEAIIQAVRSRRVAARRKDDEGEVTGD